MQFINDFFLFSHFFSSFMDLFSSDVELSNKLIENPKEVLKEIQDNIINIQNDNTKGIGCTKENISVRICKLPFIDDASICRFPQSQHVGFFIQCRGINM